ncbi:MAG: hypothetical protein HC897_01180 [Thermoanaerobaculia bacterium]|nr:hypothetical protein [Thermoanaerobaculia bacterium]
MKPVRKRQSLLGALLALALLAGTMAQALPVVEGDVEDLFALTTDDCPDCTATELAELEAGFSLILGEMRAASRNPDGVLCIANASLARELALLTFELYREEIISSQRWREFLIQRAAAAGASSEHAWRSVLDAYLEKVFSELQAEVAPDSPFADQLRIHLAIQIHRLALLMGNGTWDAQTWSSWLSSTQGGFNPTIDAVLRQEGPVRQLLDGLLLSSRPHLLWLESEQALLATLPEDFLVGDVSASRDQILAAHQAAIRNNQWTTMWNGCGTEAATVFWYAAFATSQGYASLEYTAMRDSTGSGQGEGGAGSHENNDVVFSDEITVIGSLWGELLREWQILRRNQPPIQPPGGNGGDGAGLPSLPPNPCGPAAATDIANHQLAGTCPNRPFTCELTQMQLAALVANGCSYPPGTHDQSPEPTPAPPGPVVPQLPRLPLPPPFGPLPHLGIVCSFFCGQTGGFYSGYEVSGAGSLQGDITVTPGFVLAGEGGVTCVCAASP